MSDVLPATLIIVSYLIGSIPFSYLVARIVSGTDIREAGSRNVDQARELGCGVVTSGRGRRQQLRGQCAHLDRQLAAALNAGPLYGKQAACGLGGTSTRQLT